jgi:hypothetical protein
MSIKRVTFEQLKALLTEQAGQPEMPAPESIPNYVSALSDFLADSGCGWQDEVGALLRTAFINARNGHAARLVAAGRVKSYVKNRTACLNGWNKFLLALDYEGASITGDLNPLQETLKPLLAGKRLRRIAREIGVSRDTLKSWVDRGRIPQARHDVPLERLEMHLDLEPNTLLRLVVPRRPPAPVGKTAPANAYRVRLAKASLRKYVLRALHVPEGHRLRVEIPALVRHKVEGDSSKNILQSRGTVLRRALRSPGKKSWRTRPLRAHWNGSPKILAKHWHDILDGLWVPSASRTFNTLSAFFGWATRDVGEGGAGLPLDSLTLGMLANKEHIFNYLDWWMESSGQTHGGHHYFIQVVLMLLHHEDGFLPKQEGIGALLGHTPEDWRGHCKATLEWIYKDILPSIETSFKREGTSRKPFEPIAHILDLERPLDAVMHAINRAEADRPTTGGAHEVTWARNIALIALLSSNPLRLRNLVDLTYYPDNSGQLRQTANGLWRIVIQKTEFKNFRGAAKQHDYDQLVDPAIGHLITRYIRTYRPLVGGSRPELVFVSTDNPNREFEGLDRVVHTWTKRYLEGCPGVGPHSFRHIVATHIIKTTLGNYFLAAQALHDHPMTVQKSYAHFLPSYADAGRIESYSGSMKLLKAPRRAPVRRAAAPGSDTHGHPPRVPSYGP